MANPIGVLRNFFHELTGARLRDDETRLIFYSLRLVEKFPQTSRGQKRMAHYLILESRDPYDSGDWQNMQQIAKDMQSRGNGVTLFLVQNGVIPARKGDRYSSSFAELQKLGITILADDFSLKERAIDELAEGVNTANMDRLVQLSLQSDTKTIWH